MANDKTIKHLRIPFTAKVVPFEKINDEFTICNVYICALGKNRNLSYIGKEAADEAQPTLFNIPVVGHIFEDENGEPHMGSHDGEYIKTEDGSYEWRSKCVPYGVVPQQDDLHYEEIVEKNGDVKTYIVGKLILWTGRFPELMDTKYSDECMFNQSMEINVFDYEPLEEDKNYTNILSYSYSALCLLGKSDDEKYDVEPCFPEAHVGADTYAYDDKFFELMSEMKESLSECFSKTFGKEAEQKMDNENNGVVESVEETEDFENEDLENSEPETTETETADDAAEEEFNEDEQASNNDSDNESESEEGESQAETSDNFELTNSTKYEILSNALSSFAVEQLGEDGWACTDIWVADYDSEYAYLHICYFAEIDGVSKSDCRFYRVAYSLSDNMEVSIGAAERVFVSYLTADELKKLDDMKANYQALADYKADREQKDLESTYDAAIEEFADLAGNEEYEKVLENKYSYNSVDELKNACYVIRGKYGLVAKPRKTTQEVLQVRIGAKVNTAQSARDRLHEEYGRK